MIIKNPIYGTFEIQEKQLIDLILSGAMQRLKFISQQGLTRRMLPESHPFFSRYDHSVGVMLLLRKLGASLEEQTAGLLHDVSHTTFSHVVDGFLGDPSKENYQDDAHSSYIAGPWLSGILSEYNIDPARISDFRNFHLLDKELPDLCADRLDYTLESASMLSYPEAQKLADSLIVKDSEIIFNSKEAASSFGRMYMEFQQELWASDVIAIKYFFFAKLLKLAIEKKVLKEEDLYTDDEYVMRKLEGSSDEEISRYLSFLYSEPKFKHNEISPQYTIRKKFRYVDPKYLENGKVLKLSENDSEYKSIIDAERKRLEDGIKVDIEMQ
ncbi:HD domain-containing protein [Candidatus Marsarchaeota archaeon]|nr:HD domain-containing protein [Candidatus Marsarchaeota archaeon]